MKDEQVISYQDQGVEKRIYQQKLKKILTGVLIFLVVVSLSLISYLLGVQSGKKTAPAPSNSPTPTTSLFINNPPSPTPTIVTSPTLSPSPSVNSKSKIIESVSKLDGFVSSDGEYDDLLEIRAGRNSTRVTRGFVSFDITDLSDHVEILSAKLKLYQTKIVGNPYSVGGALKIDHLTYGDTLDSDDYASAALVSNMITLSNKSALDWKEADVTSALKNDVANARAFSQFRIHFVDENIGGDESADFVYFDSSNTYSDHTGHNPQLVIKYNR